jgi:hypothetical protein
MRSIVGVDHLQLVRGGEVVAEIPLAADRRSADATVELDFAASDWLLLRAFTKGGRHPVLDAQVSATTSPVYVTVAGAPLRDAAAASYFLAWIDRLEAASGAPERYNDEAERREVLATLVAARAVFRERGGLPATAR